MRFLAVIPLLVLAVLFATPGRAAAELGCDDDPSLCPPWEDTTSATLTLTTPAGVRVTSSLATLDCTGGCVRKVEYSRWCIPGEGCEDFVYNEYSLAPTNPPAGYAPSWTGCDGVFSGRCNLTLDSNHAVTLGWTDVGAPGVAFNPPAKAGPATVIAASGSDNSGSFTYDWAVDGISLASHGNTISLGGMSEGNHLVHVRTRDGAGNVSGWLDKTIKVDKSVAVAVPEPPAFTNAATVPVGYTTDGDVPADNRKCSVNGGAPVVCASSFSPVGAGSADGTYSYTVAVTDDVGNAATSAARSFMLDRTAPVVAFTDGPTEGQAVTTKTATLSFGVTDANASSAAPTCKLDGAAVPCTTATTLVLNGLAEGAHVVAVTARDKAGNTATKERRFTVKTETGSTPSGTPGGTPGGDPGTPGMPVGDVLDVGDTPQPRGAIAAGAGWDYAATRRYTTLSRFKVKGIPQGAKVVVTCRGGGCPKRRFTLKGTGVKPVKPLMRRRLKTGTVIEIRITKPDYIGRVLRIQIRPGKAPSSRSLCLPPGASKAVACG